MYIRKVSVKNQFGLCARPATYFIREANRYKSTIWIEIDDRRVNAKSLLGVLSLGVEGGTMVSLIADGEDEEKAVEGLKKFVESGFQNEENDEMESHASIEKVRA